MMTAKARLRLQVTCNLSDEEGMKDTEGLNHGMTIELNVYTLTYAK